MDNVRWGTAPQSSDPQEVTRGFFTLAGIDFSHISDCTQSFADLLGLSTGQVLGDILDFTPPTFEKDTAWAHAELSAKNKVTFYEALEFVTGHLIPVKISAAFLPDVGVTVCCAEKVEKLPFPENGEQPYMKNIGDNLTMLKPR
tara:strand:- start:2669 stop:3100 length:432 start_codon:yes stop_codon:yes gene_type:complete